MRRGWLELDIMLGEWAEGNLKHLNSSELDEFAAILELVSCDGARALSVRVPCDL